MLMTARQRGLRVIGFTDHFAPYLVPGISFYDQQDGRILANLRTELADVSTCLEVLIGIEADYTVFGEECVDEATMEQVDYVAVSATHFHLGVPAPDESDPRRAVEQLLQLAWEAVALPVTTILVHPFDWIGAGSLTTMLETLTDDELAALGQWACEKRVALEINGHSCRKADYRQATARFFRLAHEVGARFTVSSDAHAPEQLAWLDLAVAWAQELGLSEDNFLTANELRAWHQEKRSRTRPGVRKGGPIGDLAACSLRCASGTLR